MAGILDLLTGQGGGQQQGLLDLLRASALNQAMPSGLPSDTADYGRTAPMSFAPAQSPPQIAGANQPSPLDTAQWPAGPVGAPSSANAAVPPKPALMSPAPQSAPAAAAPSPGLGDRLSAGLSNVQQSSGLIPSLINGISGFATGQPSVQSAQTANERALLAKNIDPAAIAAARGNPDLMKALFAQAYGEPKAPTSLGEGYIWNPQTKKVERAYEPADKATNVQTQVEQRRAAAEAIGLKPDHPAYQGYLLTGKMPREDAQPLSATDKKAILEADEGVLSANSAISALRKAKELSPKALGFTGAGKLASVGAMFGNDASEATVELDNTVMTNALSQLKAIFGGAPTEGERAILLQIQGSSSQPDTVRQKIYDRAIALAEARLKFNEQRANELRGGTFYKAQGGKAAPVTTPEAPPVSPADVTPIPAVPDRSAIEAEMKRRGLLK
jgi:hypothetical protein